MDCVAFFILNQKQIIEWNGLRIVNLTPEYKGWIINGDVEGFAWWGKFNRSIREEQPSDCYELKQTVETDLSW